ncbi:MAG: glutamate--tRNA ligase, partial [Deltaproteobacteria bacterium]|nr:glutamate--tRNA ligase [Deltaproteobacteria bacterium]
MDHQETEKVLPKEGQAMEKPTRVRFAPSPTGLLHVGNARTALFNYLFARQQGGTFILRLEDTDAERSTREAEATILEDLHWLGLDWDEGPEKPGAYGPYRQSERLEIYRRFANELLEKGKVYRCYCTPEELEEKRKRFLARGVPPKYDGRCRNLMAEEEKALVAEGRRASLRFKVEARRVEFEDLVKGRVSFDGLGIGDFIVLRSDGGAPYNFAAVVDDELMQVSHVIRGEDHLTNTPRQILLYQALGFPLPRFAHLSMILGPDRSPLSKRHGATAVAHFREEGYLPQALVNYLAMLGWSSEDGQEIFEIGEMVKKFSLKRVSRSSAIFDFDKLNWVNRAHLKALGGEKIVPLASPFLKKAGIPVEEKTGESIRASLEPFLEEANTLAQLAEEAKIFFDEGFLLESSAQEVLAKKENQKVLQGFIEELKAVEEFTPEKFKPFVTRLGKRVERSGQGLYLPLRVALTGKT